jgi:hypothetical protein
MKKSELTEYIKQVMSSKITTENVEDGTSNVVDTIRMDVPLFIRLLEYAREDAKTDMDLHNVTEKAISLSVDGGTLTMSDYNNIISTPESIDEMKNPKLTKIAGDIMVKFPKQGSYDAFEEFKKHIGKYKLTSDEEKEVYAVIRDKENEDLAEAATGNNVYFLALNNSTGKYIVKSASKHASKSVTGSKTFKSKGEAETEADKQNKNLDEINIGEKKLTPAEKAKKEEIVKSMKKDFKGPKSAMYAIATDKAKKVAEVVAKRLKDK